MQENPGVTLQTERLILRDFREEDWRDVHEYGSDPDSGEIHAFRPEDRRRE